MDASARSPRPECREDHAPLKIRDLNPRLRQPQAWTADKQPGRVRRPLFGFGGAVAITTLAVGLGFMSTRPFVRMLTVSPAPVVSAVSTDLPGNVQLAQAFTSTLNAHDVDALMEMFTVEDAGATV